MDAASLLVNFLSPAAAAAAAACSNHICMSAIWVNWHTAAFTLLIMQRYRWISPVSVLARPPALAGAVTNEEEEEEEGKR